jgi:uncharacterized protein
VNRLIDEDSPYLRQHAHNPVDWYPWGAEAFRRAAAENKPVFLSIGYSTCHWCHVMERESFDDAEIAAYLNENFVCIKLDREQRPDLDDIYMTGVQLMNGNGGWPMSNFLTADGKPFYAGTYYPPRDFLQLLTRLTELWQSSRDKIDQQAQTVSAEIARYTSAQSVTSDLPDLLSLAGEELLGRIDEKFGGFGHAPKFPNESQLLLLLDAFQRTGDEAIGAALRLTLDHMYQGGIYDQVAGGFHRYAVDREWLVPHFEKMLYNQAQLAGVFTQAAIALHEPAYRRVAIEICDYVIRDMCSPDGGFYSATDADSGGEEGLFFVWTLAELQVLLDVDDVALMCDLYGVSEGGNYEGRNILNLQMSVATYADIHELDQYELHDRLSRIRGTLYDVREGREHPLRDEKVITGWNGMMISALARCGYYLGEERFTDAAQAAAIMIWRQHWVDGQLWRISLHGHISIPGNLEDHACFGDALLTLYRFTGDTVWLDRATVIMDRMQALFWDDDPGGYFMGLADDEAPLITRAKSPMDGATPSGNSVAMHALIQLWQMTGDPDAAHRIRQSMQAFSGLLVKSPSAFAYMVRAIECFLKGQNDAVQFAAEGNVVVSVDNVSGRATVTFRIAHGWHIGGHDAIDVTEDSKANVAATTVSGEGIEQCTYPVGVRQTLDFSPVSSTYYQGTVLVVCSLDDSAAEIRVNLQACDQTRCLLPEELVFRGF